MLSTSTSSPILVGDRIYVVTEKGDLCAVDAHSGKVLWKLKLGIEQRNSCPLYADGKLYVPILDDPSGQGQGARARRAPKAALRRQAWRHGGEILSHIELEGRCFGTPTAYNGKVYVQTTRSSTASASQGTTRGLPPQPRPSAWPRPVRPPQLQIIPSEVLLQAGRDGAFRVRTLDANGFTVEEVKDLDRGEVGVLHAAHGPGEGHDEGAVQRRRATGGGAGCPVPSAGAFEATLGELQGLHPRPGSARPADQARISSRSS